MSRRVLLQPTVDLPDETPIDRVRFTWQMRRALIGAGLTTVRAVREAPDETLQKLCHSSADFIRATLGATMSFHGARARLSSDPVARHRNLNLHGIKSPGRFG